MRRLSSEKAGSIIRQLSGYKAFIPHKLCPDGPKISIDPECLKLISEAERALGELNGITNLLPDPDLFVAFYVQKEALLSSQIEGTQCSLDEVLQFEEKKDTLKPVEEVINYINAMNYGLKELEKLPVSTRLLNKIHEQLLEGVRGEHKNPGKFKKQQNWIGSPGALLSEAEYIPPPPEKMYELMGDLESYYHQENKLPPLIEVAIIHSYFETIHPYIDGNGRLGRLLITFMLCEKKIIDKPLLYLSLFFKEHRNEYYELLMNVRFNGAWENWIKFFLRGVRNTSKQAIETAKEIINLQKEHRQIIQSKMSQYKLSYPLYDLFCKNPILSIAPAARTLNSNYPTVKNIIGNFTKLNIISKYGDKSRYKFQYTDYLKILRRGT